MLRTNAVVVHLFNLIVTLKWFGLLDDIWDKIAGIASDIKYLTGHRLDTFFFAATACWRDPTRSKELSTVAILGFQFGLYHVVVALSLLHSNQPCFIIIDFIAFQWLHFMEPLLMNESRLNIKSRLISCHSLIHRCSMHLRAWLVRLADIHQYVNKWN